jgi:hypothetical protein
MNLSNDEGFDGGTVSSQRTVDDPMREVIHQADTRLWIQYERESFSPMATRPAAQAGRRVRWRFDAAIRRDGRMPKPKRIENRTIWTESPLIQLSRDSYGEEVFEFKA